MRWLALPLLFLRLLSLPLCAADLASVRREPNLERRSQLAVDYAGIALDTARTEYQAGNLENSAAAINEVGDAVELAWQSLLENGITSRKTD
jgi:hypothetical protein